MKKKQKEKLASEICEIERKMQKDLPADEIHLLEDRMSEIANSVLSLPDGLLIMTEIDDICQRKISKNK